MLEGQLEVFIMRKEEEQTISVYQSNHSTLPTLLGYKLTQHTCMGLSMRLIAHFTLCTTIMFHVQYAILQLEKLF